MSVQAALTRMLASRGVSLVLMVAGFSVLGRLLTPAAFGHFALAMTIFTLARTASEFGLRQYVIQGAHIGQQTLEAAAGLSMLLAAVLAAACLAVAGTPGLLDVQTARALVPLSLALLVGPVVLSTEALLQKALDFTPVAVAEFSRVAVDVGVAVGLALMGFGAVALASATLASHIAVALVLLVWAGRRYWVRPRLSGWRGFVGFGSRLVTIRLLPNLTDLLLIAALSASLGPATVGLLNRARTIQKLLDRTIFEGIMPVVLPAMSAALARGEAPLRLHRMQVDYLIAICWPGFAAIGLLADPLVMLLLGAQWEAAVPAVRILALMGLGLPFTKMSQKLFVALGATPAYLRVQGAQQAVRLVLGLAGALHSLEAVCLALVASVFWKAGHVTVAMRRRYGRSGEPMRAAVLRGAALTLGALAGPVAVLGVELSAEATLACALPLSALGWGAALFATGHPLAGEVRAAAAGLRRERRGSRQ